MEISPVANVRITPMVRSKDTDLGMTDVYNVERSSRTGDETYTPDGAKAATGFDSGENDDGGESRQDDEDTYDDLEDEAETKPELPAEPDGQIDLIA